MSFFRFWAVLHKEFRHIRRDRRILFLVTLSPSIMLFSFAYLFAFDAEQVRIGIWDSDRSELSRRFVASLSADRKLILVGQYSGYESLYEGIRRSEIQLGVVIPPDFATKLNAGERASVQAISDGSDAITARQALGRFQERAGSFGRSLSISGAASTGSITIQAQAWYNRDLESTFAMVPGLLPIVLILPSLALALAVTREKELGSFETLAATPIQAAEYLLGKLTPYVAFGLVSAVLASLLAMVWFQVPLRGAVPDLILMTAFYLMASLGESLFISGLMTSQGTAMRIILLLFFVPSFFLTGVTIPVDMRSGPGQFVSMLLPATYYVQITRGVFLKAMGLGALLSQSSSLLGMGAITFVLSVLSFRKQVD